jgi:4a-hydroxytetrahydrobiopterin dehydratase
MSKFVILTEVEINRELSSELSDWTFDNNSLNAKFKLNSFRQVILLVNLVAIEAEVLNHHPTYTHSFKNIEFSITTHDAGNKVTNLDILMAKYITEEFKNLSK